MIADTFGPEWETTWTMCVIIAQVLSLTPPPPPPPGDQNVKNVPTTVQANMEKLAFGSPFEGVCKPVTPCVYTQNAEFFFFAIFCPKWQGLCSHF